MTWEINHLHVSQGLHSQFKKIYYSVLLNDLHQAVTVFQWNAVMTLMEKTSSMYMYQKDFIICKIGFIKFCLIEWSSPSCGCSSRTIKSVLSVWLDTYPEDFRTPPHYECLETLLRFAEESVPDNDLAIKAQHKLDRFLKEMDETGQSRSSVICCTGQGHQWFVINN